MSRKSPTIASLPTPSTEESSRELESAEETLDHTAVAARLATFGGRIDALERGFGEQVRQIAKVVQSLHVRVDDFDETGKQLRVEMADHRRQLQTTVKKLEEGSEKATRVYLDTKAKIGELDEKFATLATPTKVIAPVVAELKQTIRKLEELTQRVDTEARTLRKQLEQWVPDFRRKGRSPGERNPDAAAGTHQY